MVTPADLARRVLAAAQSAADPPAHDAVLVSEVLRSSLSKLVGTDGFVYLLRRAMVLASEEVPSLQSVKVGVDGSLEGWEYIAADAGPAAECAGNGGEAIAVTTHLLGLLITFVGEPLTVKLLQAAWPDTPLDQSNPESRG